MTPEQAHTMRRNELANELSWNPETVCNAGQFGAEIPLVDALAEEMNNTATRQLFASIIRAAGKGDAFGLLEIVEREIKIALDNVVEAELPTPYQREMERIRNINLDHRDARILAEKEEA